ncbi:MAG TPA: 3-deoxy-8-phosphooctulonate synthase [Candidatus Hydrogenedentes bacterium]|nr:3-deoxy-8-phosphooctulonate synthase [Candidatus Hydrogenedentota bacterium]
MTHAFCTTADFLFIAGPCVIESEELTLRIAQRLKEIMSAHMPMDFVFKASFDKANRTSATSYRGPGLQEGLRILAKVREEVGVRVLTDVHDVDQVFEVADVVDVLQIPAFLCRQTDLVVAAASTLKPLNIKKAQFMAPEDMQYIAEKARVTGNNQIAFTERGSCFGYHNLVVDFRSFSTMRALGYPVIFDATHSVQIPSQGGKSSGRREFVRPLARAAAAYGIDGLFCEVHPEPEKALSDGPNMLPLDEVDAMLREVMAVRRALGFGEQ